MISAANEMRKRKLLESRGFTLLEVLVAMVIVAVGLLAIAQMQVIAIRTNAQSRDVTEASTLAADQLEHLKSLPFDHPDLIDVNPDNNGDLTVADPDDTDHTDADYPYNPDDTPTGTYGRSWSVADFGANLKSVVVTTNWLSGPNRVPKQVQFATVIARTE